MSGSGSLPGEEAVIISDDPTMLDFDVVHAFLTRSYWSPGIPREFVERAAANSMCFGVYVRSSDPAVRHRQVGYARVITDKATFAYLADVFILESHRGQGLSKRLMRAILGHPDLQNLRRFMLITRDAHGLYQHFGFGACSAPESVMEKREPDIYARLAAGSS